LRQQRVRTILDDSEFFDMTIRDLGGLPFDITLYSTDLAYVWRPQWQANVGVPAMDLTMDVRNIQLGANAAVSLKPALQFAPTRTDRPEDGAPVTGTARTTNGISHYQAALASPSKLFVRDGIGFQLTAGSFARIQGTLHTAFRSLGLVLPAEEITVQPTNDSTAKNVYPLGGGRPLLATRVDKARLVVFGYGNLTTSMNWQLCCRFFNDPLARGDWTLIDMSRNPQTTDFEANTSDVAFSNITTTDFHWLELGLAVWKGQGGDPNSRCVFHVIPAVIYV